mgnify:CR=1 FL=1
MSEFVKTVSRFRNKSYSEIFPNKTFSSEENYFLQFNGYTVYLPKISPPPRALNIFEISILKLLAVEPFTPQDLSERLCLEVDLINFICARLFEMKFLDKFRQLTAAGKNFLGQKTEPFANKNILPYLVLVTRDTGEIFPKLFPRSTWQISKLLGAAIIQNYNSASAKVKRKCIFVEQKAKISSSISQRILHEILENFNVSHVNKIFIEQDFNIPSSYSEPIFLHIKAILKNYEDDFFLVSDGQESNDELLHSYICRQQKDILANLKWHGLRR